MSLGTYSQASRNQVPKSVIGKSITDFKLISTQNDSISLSSFPNAKGFIVVFTCNHCPFAKLYTKRLNQLHNKFKTKGIVLLAINPMDTVMYEDETLSLMKQKAKKEKFKFHYLQDADQKVSKDFSATHTPQAFIVWRENNQWVIKYSGSIDDNGQQPELAKPLIANAIESLLKGVPINNPEMKSFGCAIYYRK